MGTPDFPAWQYMRDMQNLINGVNGRVYLDVESPRVCIKGKEERGASSRDVGGYATLPDDEVFPFYELRSAAVDMRGVPRDQYDATEVRKRITAQLDTCVE